uniref:Rab-GAP TBC domain-containing protein n=1 Tax=Brassica campestris TaxID=3711 RepID=M4DKI5_BRACM
MTRITHLPHRHAATRSRVANPITRVFASCPELILVRPRTRHGPRVDTNDSHNTQPPSSSPDAYGFSVRTCQNLPGHPALDDDGSNALRRLLTAYARHNPSVGYCQVACVTAPWFLSIFINMLPWESVLRVWDVLLFEGNRVMLFRTALALMEFYGPTLITTKDAGDAITLLQSMTGSTFERSQLIEQLEQGVRELRKLVSDKKDQEAAMIQVLMGIEQEHKVTEDARRAAEQDAAAQRHAAQVLQLNEWFLL